MTTDAVGGVWHYALELGRGLRAEGVEVVLASMGPRPSAAQRSEARRLGLALYESDHALEWMDSPWRDLERAGEWLLALEARHAPDVIHLNGYAHAALPWHAPVLVVAHSCVLSWWRAVRGVEAPAEWNRYRDAVAAGLHAASLVVAPTQAMLDALHEHYGAFAAFAGRVIPNGRCPAEFAHPAQKQPFVLGVGRLWDEAKNAAALARVAADLPWPVRLAGDTTSPEGRTPALPNVALLGWCAPARLATLYASAALYAHPARYEPFGLSVLEAALAGCALVLGDIPSLRELWSDAAVFVAPDDPAALREALASLIEDSDRRRRLAARARMRALRFTAAQMTTRYLAAYHELIASAASAPVAPLPLHRSPSRA